MTGEIALFVGLLGILYFVLTTIPVSRRVRLLKKEIAIERTRSCWAEARVQLMTLAREGKLSPHSATFRTFYGLQTFVLRRPEEYDAIARELASSFLQPGRKRETAWSSEMEEWPEEMKCVLDKMAEGTIRLVAVHATGRFLLRLPRLLVERWRQNAFRHLNGWVKKIPSLRAEWTLIAARDEMLQLKAA